jgi:hypothetical protein
MENLAKNFRVPDVVLAVQSMESQGNRVVRSLFLSSFIVRINELFKKLGNPQFLGRLVRILLVVPLLE